VVKQPWKDAWKAVGAKKAELWAMRGPFRAKVTASLQSDWAAYRAKVAALAADIEETPAWRTALAAIQARPDQGPVAGLDREWLQGWEASWVVQTEEAWAFARADALRDEKRDLERLEEQGAAQVETALQALVAALETRLPLDNAAAYETYRKAGASFRAWRGRFAGRQQAIEARFKAAQGGAAGLSPAQYVQFKQDVQAEVAELAKPLV